MEKIKYLLHVLILLLFTVGCKQGSIVELNKKVVDNICYEVSLLPKEFLEQNDTVSIADLIYLKLTVYEEKNTMRIQELFKQANYNKLLYYVNSRITNDFSLIQSEKAYNPIQVYFENNNRIGNKLVFLLAFEKKDLNMSDDIVLRFNDNIFNNGFIQLAFNKK